jgi:iron(III) transport system permease protein
MFMLTWAAPVAALSVKLTAHDVHNAVTTYSYEIPASIGVALAAGAVVFVIALSTWQTPRLRKVILVWAVIWGIVPGAVVGESLIAGYDRALLMPVYGHGAILVLGYVARFAWVGLAAAGALHHRTDRTLLELAAVDGATRAQRLWRVILPVHGPLLAAASGLVTALAVAELPVSTMIRPPGLNPIAAIIIEKFHRFEYGLLIALCLVLVGVAAGAILLLTWAAHRLASD